MSWRESSDTMRVAFASVVLGYTGGPHKEGGAGSYTIPGLCPALRLYARTHRSDSREEKNRNTMSRCAIL